jgi:hypothetical protein
MKTRMIFFAAVAVIWGVMVSSCGSSKAQQRVSDEQRAKIDANTEQYRKTINN